MKIIYFGKKRLLKTIKRYFDDVRVVDDLTEFFTEPSFYHILDGQLLDDLKRRSFTELVVNAIKNHPSIDIHVVWIVTTCKGPGAVGILGANGAFDHEYFPTSKIPFDQQLLDEYSI